MRRFSTALVVALVLAGCGGDKPLTQFVNTPPEATLAADPDTLILADTSVVTCSVHDPDPDVISFRWSANAGRFIRRDPTMSQVSWIAPATEGVDTIRVTVFDLSDSVRAQVRVVVVGHIGTVLGLVKDATSGEGLAGARIEIGGRTGTSGTDGSFRLELVPPGIDTLHASREGYEPFARLMSVREGTNEVEIPLQQAVPKARLFGTVTTSNSRPVAGAACRVGEAEVSTDISGNYEFAGVPLGPQELRVQAGGFETARESVNVQPPEIRRDIVLHAVAPAPPQGQLTVSKLADSRVRLDWVPLDPPESIAGFDLLMIASGENEGLPQPVPGGPLPRNGGTREVTGEEGRRYRFAVVGVNVDGVVGAASPYTPTVVLVLPSALAHVPAGPVIMGSYPDAYGNELHPGNPVYVPAFALETQEVTNRQFVAFLVEALARGVVQVSDAAVRAGSDTLLLFAGSPIDRDPLNDGFSTPTELQDYPVTGITWFGARAYAGWYGRRLPKEAEWEKAARGGDDSTGTYLQTSVHVGTKYPWGDAPPSALRANYERFFGGKRPVGSFPDGAARWWDTPIYDLAGNVWEWCDDWYALYANPHQPPTDGPRKVVRGGAWDSPAAEIRVGNRWFLEPARTSTKIGFRCASDPAKDGPG